MGGGAGGRTGLGVPARRDSVEAVLIAPAHGLGGLGRGSGWRLGRRLGREAQMDQDLWGALLLGDQDDDARDIRGAYRNHDEPVFRGSFVGFRCAKTRASDAATS